MKLPAWLDRPRVALLATWALTTLLLLKPGFLVPDGMGYVAWVASGVNDGDFLFYDEWVTSGQVRDGRMMHQGITPTDHLANHWQPGSAVLWLPGTLVGEMLWHVVPGLHAFPHDGMRLPWNVGCVFTGAVLGLLTLLVAHAAATRVAPAGAASAAAIAAWFGSPLMYYALVDPLMAHAATALACAVVVLLSLRLRDAFTVEHLVGAGLATGLAFACRAQAAPFVLVPLILVPLATWRAHWRRAGWFVAGGFVGALPQLVTSAYVFGSPLRLRSSGEGPGPWSAFERFWTWEPYLSSYHGMFTWTPILAPGIIGLVMLARRGEGASRRLAVAGLVSLFVQAAVNSTMDRPFWGTLAFGQRRFDGMAVFFVIGIAVMLARLPRWLGALIVVPCLAWTTGLLLAVGHEIDLNEYQLPGELVRACVAGWSHVSERLHLLSFVPASLTGLVLLVMGTCVLMFLVAAVLLARASPRLRAGVAVAWLLVTSATFAWWGSRGRSRTAAWRDAIERTRALGDLQGSMEVHLGILEHELVYAERSGRERLAARTRAELEEFRARIDARLAEAGR